MESSQLWCPVDQRLQEHQQSACLAAILAHAMGPVSTSKDVALSLRVLREVEAEGGVLEEMARVGKQVRRARILAQGGTDQPVCK